MIWILLYSMGKYFTISSAARKKFQILSIFIDSQGNFFLNFTYYAAGHMYTRPWMEVATIPPPSPPQIHDKLKTTTLQEYWRVLDCTPGIVSIISEKPTHFRPYLLTDLQMNMSTNHDNIDIFLDVYVHYVPHNVNKLFLNYRILLCLTIFGHLSYFYFYSSDPINNNCSANHKISKQM